MARTWSAVLARLGVPTGDGRIIDPAGVSFRDLPMPLMWQEKTEEGHGGSYTVGAIESVSIENGMVTGRGSLLNLFPDRDRLIELIDSQVVGPSVDIADDVEYVMDDQDRIVITRAGVGGATLVPIEAFSDVSITMDPEQAEPPADPDAVYEELAVPEEGADRWGTAMSASAAPEVLPPAEWFTAPDVDRVTPLTVTDTGRVFGHIAPWGECHVGLPGCVTAPSSPTSYSYFHVGTQRTAEGALLPVGTLTVGGGHADASKGFRAAMEHYDDVGAAVARVVAGEDEHGIWVAGWLLPGTDPVRREQFMSSPVSGDWRSIGGALEMIAVCSVNTPGFPVPRARVSFSNGAQRSLVGTFGIRPVAGELAASAVADTAAQARAKWAWLNSNGK
jgi:hypothetical protein